jgi:SPP1 family predicted phage head-tail adaptor
MIRDLRDRILIQTSKTDTDEDGNHVLLWKEFYSCAAYVNNLSGKEYWNAAQVNAEKDICFIIRYSSEVKDLDSEHFRIVFQQKIYNIAFVDHVKYEKKMLKLRASLEEG